MKETINVDLNDCRSVEDIRGVVLASLKDETLVRNRMEARGWFRANGCKGRIKARTALEAKKQLNSVGPLHRAILVNAIVMEYFIDPDGKKLYSCDIVKY